MRLAKDDEMVHALAPDRPDQPLTKPFCQGEAGTVGLSRMPYGQKIKTAAKMAVVQASTMKQLNAPFRTAPHCSA